MKTTTLTERRAADRKKMADALQALIIRCGSACERIEDPEEIGPNAIWLKVTAPEGLLLTVTLEKDSPQPDVHVLSWHMAFDSNKRLNNDTFGGDVNPVHRHKATYIAYGFEDLCKQLEKGLLMAKDGSAYLPEVEAEAVAA